MRRDVRWKVWRRRWALLGALAVLAAVLLAACGASRSAELQGTVLNPPQRTAEFTLVDQFGEQCCAMNRL